MDSIIVICLFLLFLFAIQPITEGMPTLHTAVFTAVASFTFFAVAGLLARLF